MTTTTLHTQHLAQPTSVGTALHELAIAAQRLAMALWAATTQRTHAVAKPLTAFEEAENLRAMADQHALKDPVFAYELYAAADRHERAATR